MRVLLIIGLILIALLFAGIGGVEIEKVETLKPAATACADGNGAACGVVNNHPEIITFVDENGVAMTLSAPTLTPAAP